jgi:hypothetical protein
LNSLNFIRLIGYTFRPAFYDLGYRAAAAASHVQRRWVLESFINDDKVCLSPNIDRAGSAQGTPTPPSASDLSEWYVPMKIGVVVFPGSNCDHDAWYAISHNLGQRAGASIIRKRA